MVSRMSLGSDQRKFTRMISMLITWAYDNGFELTFGDAYAKDGHSENSFHYKRLAVDLNLFIYGVYKTKTEDHKPLGTYWKSIGGTWGGDFKRKDGNHYSYKEQELIMKDEKPPVGSTETVISPDLDIIDGESTGI